MKITFQKMSAQEMLKKKIKKYFYINPTILSGLILSACFIFIGLNPGQNVQAKDGLVTCAMIQNYDEAKKDADLYKSNPIKYKQFARLDLNQNGIPCERRFKK